MDYFLDIKNKPKGAGDIIIYSPVVLPPLLLEEILNKAVNVESVFFQPSAEKDCQREIVINNN